MKARDAKRGRSGLQKSRNKKGTGKYVIAEKYLENTRRDTGALEEMERASKMEKTRTNKRYKEGKKKSERWRR